jgi:ATP-dependent Zn protease
MTTKQRQKPPWIGVLIYMGIAGLIFYASIGTRGPVSKHVSYSDFSTAIQDGQVEAVRVTTSELIGTMKTIDQAKDPVSIITPRLPTMDESWLMQELRERRIQIIAERPTTNWWTGIFVWLFPVLMILFFYSLAARSRMAQSGLTNVVHQTIWNERPSSPAR